MGPKGSGMIKWVKTELTSTFSMVDMGPISFHLGLKVKRNWHEKTIKLPQPGYIEKVLAKFYPDKAHSINTSRKETVPLEQRSDRKACPSERERYQKMNCISHVPHGRDKAKRCFCHISRQLFYQRSQPPTHGSREDDSAVHGRFETVRYHLRGSSQTARGRIFRFHLGQR